MRKILMFLVSIFTQNVIAIGQNDIEPLFYKGIYLENRNFHIPWKINFNQIVNYGNPVVEQDPANGTRYLLKWDSVKILNGILVNLFLTKPKKEFSENKLREIHNINGTIDSSEYIKFVNYFIGIVGGIANSPKKKTGMQHVWVINDHTIRAGFSKIYGYYFSFSNK